MIDIKFLRGNPGLVQKSAKDKGIEVDVDHILEIDKEFQRLSSEVQKLREDRNKFAREKNIEEGKKLKDKLEKEEKAARAVEEELKDYLFKIPNLPLKGVPVGEASDFEVIREEGKPKNLNFKPKDHLEIGEALDIIDVKRAAKVAGSRFAYLKNEGVLLEFALVQLVLDKLVKNGFSPIIPPALIKKEITEGLGYWHGSIDKEHTANENYYLVLDREENEEGLYLIGTAEHSIVSMYKDETFSGNDLPKKFIGFSPAFRREAGSYGKDTRGILRVHQFDKLEMVEFVRPEEDEAERKKMLGLVEELMKDLELPYRVVRLASKDLGFPTAETIDIETWIPSEEKYRETHSISTTTDFQARRLNIKYQDGPPAGGDKKFVHILNGTAFAVGRTIVAILENYQQEDGSVKVPEVLQKYLPAGRQDVGKIVIKK